jgi:hypothetical protein
MALQIAIQYHNLPVTYDVTVQEENVFHFRFNEEQSRTNGEYLPEKLIIRRKGKIWISDLEDHMELVTALTNEVTNINTNTNI